MYVINIRTYGYPCSLARYVAKHLRFRDQKRGLKSGKMIAGDHDLFRCYAAGVPGTVHDFKVHCFRGYKGEGNQIAFRWWSYS